MQMFSFSICTQNKYINLNLCFRYMWWVNAACLLSSSPDQFQQMKLSWQRGSCNFLLIKAPSQLLLLTEAQSDGLHEPFLQSYYFRGYFWLGKGYVHLLIAVLKLHSSFDIAKDYLNICILESTESVGKYKGKMEILWHSGRTSKVFFYCWACIYHNYKY